MEPRYFEMRKMPIYGCFKGGSPHHSLLAPLYSSSLFSIHTDSTLSVHTEAKFSLVLCLRCEIFPDWGVLSTFFLFLAEVKKSIDHMRALELTKATCFGAYFTDCNQHQQQNTVRNFIRLVSSDY